MPKQLTNLTVKEVSVVPKGANGKKLLLLKSAEGDLAAQVRSTPASFTDRIKKLLKSLTGPAEEQLSPQAQTGLEACARILAPVKDEITDDHMDKLQAEIGIGEGSHEEPEHDEGNEMSKPTEKELQAAKVVAEKAYGEHLEKLGYAKYPEGKLSMKAGKKGHTDDDDDEEDEPMGKSHEPIKVLKEDGTLNLDAAPAETRPFLDHIAKAMNLATQRADAAEKKCVDLAKELVDNKLAVRKTDIVNKAASLRNLPQESTVLMLELADAKGAETFEKVFKGLQAQNTQIGASSLLTELGSGTAEGGANGGSVPIMSKLEKAVGDIVQKSHVDGKPITKEMAMADFLSTAAGQQIYAEEKNRRTTAHPSGA